MFKKWFGEKKNKTEEIIMSPLDGKVVDLVEVPDPTFSEKMIGEGVAIIPENGRVLSPVNGEIIQIFPTKHAVGIRSEQGLEILIHIGLETVTMNGDGFTAFVSAGDRVELGQPLIEFSIEKVEANAKSTITPVVITNPDHIGHLQVSLSEKAKAAETFIMKIEIKK